MFDIHCHVLPGVDDGAKNLEESLAMLQAAGRAGIDRIVCTPHVRDPWFDVERMKRAYEMLRPYAERLGIQLDMGYEVYWIKLGEIGLSRAPEFTLADTNLFLLEFSNDALPPNWRGLITALQDMDLQVIVAHPERYAPIQQNLDIARELRDMGCYLQLSANFHTTPKWGPKTNETARELIRTGMADYIATDGHRVEHYHSFTRALSIAQSLGM